MDNHAHLAKETICPTTVIPNTAPTQGLEHISKILPIVLADIFQAAAAQHSEPTSSADRRLRWAA